MDEIFKKSNFQISSMLPDLYFFNPTCEPAIANGSIFYTAPARLRKLEEDLSYLPAWLASEKDQVLVHGETDCSFLSKMQELGFQLPEMVQLKKVLSDPSWLQQPKGSLLPWGWSPATYKLFEPVISGCGEDFRRSAVASWQEGHKILYSRLTGIAVLKETLKTNEFRWMPESFDLPVVCHSIAQIQTEISRHKSAVVKSPWSSSGRGLLLFPNPDSQKKNEEVLSGMIKQQGFVSVEPWLNKVIDLSYQFYSKDGILVYKGRTFFETDPKGRYLRNFLTNSPETTEEVSDFLREHDSEVVDVIKSALSHSEYTRIYQGWIGVDSMVYRDKTGDLKIQPIVEINGRFTMGALALKLREKLAEGSKGHFQIHFSTSISFLKYAQKQEAEKPLMLRDGKIVSGFLPLTPPLETNHFGAYIVAETH